MWFHRSPGRGGSDQCFGGVGFSDKYKQLAVLLVYPGLFIGAVWNTAGVGMVIFRISQPAAVEQLKCQGKSTTNSTVVRSIAWYASIA